MTDQKAKELSERYERMLRGIAKETCLVANEYYTGKRHVATFDASLWTRLKVRFLNWRDQK